MCLNNDKISKKIRACSKKTKCEPTCIQTLSCAQVTLKFISQSACNVLREVVCVALDHYVIYYETGSASCACMLCNNDKLNTINNFGSELRLSKCARYESMILRMIVLTSVRNAWYRHCGSVKWWYWCGELFCCTAHEKGPTRHHRYSPQIISCHSSGSC